MTYLEFLIIFLIVPLIFMVIALKKSHLPHKKEYVWGIATLIILAVTYTTPWDNYLVATKVWWYGKDRVIGTIGYVPIEEYMFFVLQTIFTGLWCFFLQKKFQLVKEASVTKVKLWVMMLYSLIFLFGLYSLTLTSTTYLGLILSWALPVLILQWALGGQYLLNNLKIFLISFLAPSAYLWIADAFAIDLKIWSISEKFTTGAKLWNLPVEEAIFFLVTNLMVAQGLILFIVMEKEVERVLRLRRKFFL